MIKFLCESPIAYESDDHKFPWGTRTSNAKSEYFKFKLLRLFDESVDWSLLDLGCSAGGFVESLHEDGVAAFGIEGSDYNRINHRGSWAKLDNIRLFTGDITKTYHFELSGSKLTFDVITAWDVLEHIPAELLPTLCDVMKNNLREDGIVILSIATIPDVVNGIDLHKTVMPKDKWVSFFEENGLTRCEEIEKYLAGHSARGKRTDERTGFNIVLQTQKNTRAKVPNQGKFEKLLNHFVGSKLHSYIRRLLST